MPGKKLSFSGHIVKKFRRPTILQLNIEGLTASKMNILHIAVPAGGQGAISPQVSKIWAKFKFFEQRYKKFGQSQEFQGIDIDQLQKLVTKFR